MKRSSGNTESLVYAYGCGQPTSGWRAAEVEHEKCTTLWDRLVDIELAYHAAIEAAARNDSPEIDAAVNEICAISAAIKACESVAEKKAFIASIRAARAKLRPMVWVWQRQHMDEMREIEVSRRAAVRSARMSVTVDAAPADRTFWCNSNAVLARYDTARIETLRRGRRLRHHDIDRDDGCLTIQIQRTSTGLGASADELRNGSVRSLSIGSQVSRTGQTLAEMRVDADGSMIRFPIWMHRPLPHNCRIKHAQFTWRMEGGRIRHRLCLTISMPKVERVAEGSGRCTVSISPEMRGRWLRVATVSAENQPPEWIDLEPHWSEMMDRVDHLPAVIDNEALPIRQRMRAKLMRPGLWRRLILRRREKYRLAARAIAMRYAEILIDTPALSEQAYLERGKDANAVRHRASAHVLVAELQHQARKHGASITIRLADASAKVPQRVRRRRAKVSSGSEGHDTASLAIAARSRRE